MHKLFIPLNLHVVHCESHRFPNQNWQLCSINCFPSSLVKYTNWYICICNSMARSEIWDKFHECCSENGKNCMRRSRVQFCHSHYNTSEIYPKISHLAML